LGDVSIEIGREFAKGFDIGGACLLEGKALQDHAGRLEVSDVL